MKSKRKKIINILIEFIFQALFLRMHFLFFLQVLLIYFWLCWVFAAAKAFSLGVASGAIPQSWCTGFSLWWLLPSWGMGSRALRLQCCSTWSQQLQFLGSRAQSQ